MMKKCWVLVIYLFSFYSCAVSLSVESFTSKLGCEELDITYQIEGQEIFITFNEPFKVQINESHDPTNYSGPRN
jgi:hypothetical protein